MSTSVAWSHRPVFMTSTFRDMHAARDHLHSVALPELEERRRPVLAVDKFLDHGPLDQPAKLWRNCGAAANMRAAITVVPKLTRDLGGPSAA